MAWRCGTSGWKPARFQLPAVNEKARSVRLTSAQLTLILSGIDLVSVRQRKRYRRPA